MEKICSRCGFSKDYSLFNKCARSSDGLFSWCRDCAKAYTTARYKADPEYWRSRNQSWAEQNREKSRAIKTRYRENNYEKDYEAKLKWRLENIEKDRETKREWEKRNRDYCAQKLAKYRASKLEATPKWLSSEDHELMGLVYAEANHRGLEVDHIVPLRGESVCGLHVYWNTQLLTSFENQSENNQWPYEPRVPF